MNLDVKPGRYIVAVSGGVDSMVLLDILRQLTGVELVVAHFDHGIRPDSAEDRRLVEQVATGYDLQFVYANGKLGAKTSEATARTARYEFLQAERTKARAGAIITAHHQDDVLETAIINMLRGTGRKGLSSLGSNKEILRPLLGLNKQQLRDYAAEHNLQWREDSTNQDTTYLRNYIRLNLLASMSAEDKQKLLSHVNTASLLNQDIDQLLQGQLQSDVIDRQWFISLPHVVAREVMAGWLRNHSQTFDSKNIEKLVVSAKTLAPGKQASVTKKTNLIVSKDRLALQPTDR